MYGHMCARGDSRSCAYRMHFSCPRPNIARLFFLGAAAASASITDRPQEARQRVFSRAIRCFLWCQLSFTALRGSSHEMNGALRWRMPRKSLVSPLNFLAER